MKNVLYTFIGSFQYPGLNIIIVTKKIIIVINIVFTISFLFLDLNDFFMRSRFVNPIQSAIIIIRKNANTFVFNAIANAAADI